MVSGETLRHPPLPSEPSLFIHSLIMAIPRRVLYIYMGFYITVLVIIYYNYSSHHQERGAEAKVLNCRRTAPLLLLIVLVLVVLIDRIDLRACMCPDWYTSPRRPVVNRGGAAAAPTLPPPASPCCRASSSNKAFKAVGTSPGVCVTSSTTPTLVS